MTSRRIFAAVALLCALNTPAFAQSTKAQLNTEITAQFPDNAVGAITPFKLRTVTSDIVNSIMPTSPVVSGNLACFNGTTGLLKDCGSSPLSSSLTVGTSTVNSGTPGAILYNNAGVLGNLATIPNSLLTNPSLTINGTTCTLGAACSPAASLVVGTTTVASGVSLSMLYNNNGVLGSAAVVGYFNALSTNFLGLGDNITDAITQWTATGSSRMPLLVLDRAITGTTAVNENGATDLTTYSTTTGISNAYASWSARGRVLSPDSSAWDHVVGFESLMNYAGTGGIAHSWGFLAAESSSSASGVIAEASRFYARDGIGTASITTNVGLRIDNLTRGTSANWSILAGTAPSQYSGYAVYNGTALPPVGAAGGTYITGTITGGTLTATGQAWLYNTAGLGAVLQGDGSSFDVVIRNKSAASALAVPTGTTNVSIGGNLTIGGITGSTQCLQASSAGLVSGTGSACGSGSASLTIGTTVIASGTTTRVLFDNAGVLGEYAITGSGNVAMSASPTFTGTLTAATIAATTINAFTLGGTIAGGGNQINNVVIGASTPLAGSFTTASASTSVTSPLFVGAAHAGGTTASSTLSLQSTTGTGTSDAIIFQTGSQVERARFTTAGLLNIGASTTTADSALTLNANTGSSVAPTSAVQFHMVGADSTTAGVGTDSYGAGTVLTFRRADGTLASKSAVAAGVFPVVMLNQNWNGSAYGNSASIDFQTFNLQSGTDSSGNVRFRTTPGGSTTLTAAAYITPSGGISIGSTMVNSGAGTLNLKPQTFASLTACSGTIEGTLAAVTDSTVNTWGTAIAGSGANHVIAVCTNTSWKVAGI